MLREINPDMRIQSVGDGYNGQRLNGYVFLCVDNIELRRKIAVENKNNPYIRAMFDVRIRLTDAQHYAADWHNTEMVEDFIASMNFTHEEAVNSTPMSACNIALSVAPTVRVISSLAVANFTNFVKQEKMKKYIFVDAFHFTIDTWPLNGNI